WWRWRRITDNDECCAEFHRSSLILWNWYNYCANYVLIGSSSKRRCGWIRKSHRQGTA
ncbi:unnamed protein product, partial [Amoebophrya sp. A25]